MRVKHMFLQLNAENIIIGYEIDKERLCDTVGGMVEV